MKRQQREGTEPNKGTVRERKRERTSDRDLGAPSPATVPTIPYRRRDTGGKILGEEHKDHRLEVRGNDVEVQGRPAGQHSRTKPRGQDEKGARAGTIVEPSKTNHGEITLDLSAAGRSGGRGKTKK